MLVYLGMRIYFYEAMAIVENYEYEYIKIL
jgi:hypothetical protein